MEKVNAFFTQVELQILVQKKTFENRSTDSLLNFFTQVKALKCSSSFLCVIVTISVGIGLDVGKAAHDDAK